VESLQRLSRPIDTRVPPITLAAPSYMLAQWLQRIVDCRPCLRLRVLELPPATLRAYASQNIFDVAIFPSAPDRLTTPWVGICVGEMASGLFTTPATARRLGPAPVEEASLREIPFIMPVAKHQGLFAAIGDDCPLTAASRSLGHEAQSITSALILAAHTGHLVFGPRLAATEYLQSGELVEVPVRGWNVCEPILVACNGDRVLAPVQLAIVRTLRAALRATSAA
jgi:DNA-binding transcriptional LysR family regulator